MIQLDSVRTFKSHQAHAAASSFIPLLGSQTAVVTAMNGIPWWYFYKECSEFEGENSLRRSIPKDINGKL